MSRQRDVSGGGRAVEVGADRLARWFDRFAERNDGVRATTLTPTEVVVHGGDGTTATVGVPFAPLDVDGEQRREGLDVAALVEHISRPRRVGLLLVRLGGHSLGVAEGGSVVLSRTDRRLVHGRSAAGGWSQHRFARRREGQARQALRAAAEDVREVLVPRLGELDAVVLGGDRRALDELREDRRLAPVFAKAQPWVLDVGEPRRTVLDDAAERVRAVEIIVRDPA
ncbi:acVLRF1 family peptidyl-tRNA hydrolase [Amycolatopsis palatopharyngis]|uniref:acVLRF1 family peptidyl-tRNA hydrolase n=1 Tax=Amycolatopsis palatopharyngis TaxID=187982 RepID=UPI000E235FBF|nr:acVLRF1 family peptidyl-tRNA hydrolase [Amycolatopsis palatopharyngis]